MDKYRGNSRHSWTVSKFIENIKNDSDGLEEPMCQSRSSSRSTLESSDSMSNDFNTTTKNVQDFRILRKLGHGGFGRVFLAKYTGDDGQLVAMKVIVKKDIPNTRADKEHVKAEHVCLTNLTHPFLVKLYCCYQTPSKLFYAMEFLQGGELFTWMEKFGVFPTDIARFYLAEIFLAIEYLHDKNVIFRDIKPENVMLDNDGHIRLIDFGLSKLEVTEDSSTFTRTLCGTNSYMAPEVVQKDFYGKSADWWSFGILAYDMMNGGPPYKSSDKHEVYRQIVEDPVHYSRKLDLLTKRFLQKLLTKNPETRLGHSNVGGTRAIREHKFFDYDNKQWIDIYLKKVTAPFKHLITVSNETDLTFFDNLPNTDMKEMTKLKVEIPNDEDAYFPNFSYTDPDF